MYMCMAKVPFKVQVGNKLQLASHHPGTWLHSPVPDTSTGIARSMPSLPYYHQCYHMLLLTVL